MGAGRDLTSKRLIVTKGMAFLALAVMTAGLLLDESRSLRTLVLLSILVWSACRFYYFLFYVLHRYVNPDLRYSGWLSLLKQIRRPRGAGPDARTGPRAD
jgi:hypothetical protein